MMKLQLTALFSCLLLWVSASALELNLESDVVRNGEPNRLLLHNKSVSPVARTLKIRLENGKNATVMPEQTLTVKANQTGRITLPIPEKYGIYTVIVKPAEAKEWRRKFAYLPSRVPVEGKDSDFQFGVNFRFYHNLGIADMDRQMKMAKECGVTLARHSVRLWDVEKRQGEYDFSVKDAEFALLEKYQIRTMLILFGWSKWAEAKNWKMLAPKRDRRHNRLPDSDAFARFAGIVAGRYGKDTRFFEICNEPDLIMFANYSLRDYLPLLNKTSAAIKKILPKARVMNGGIATPEGRPSPESDEDYFEKFLLRAGRSDYDIVAFHHHSTHSTFRQHFKKVEDLMKKTGVVKSVFPGECGFPAFATVKGEQEQAEVVWKKILYSMTKKSPGYIWYNLRDNRNHASNSSEGSYGLIGHNFQPKPAYAAYNALTHYFTGARFVRTLSAPPKAELYLFRAANGDWLIPFWTDDDEGNTRLLISNLETTVLQADFFGNETPLPVFNGFGIVQPKTEPRLLRIAASKGEPAFSGDLLKFNRELFVPQKRPLNFSVSLSNPFPKRWNGELLMNASAPFTVAPTKIAFDLAPRETRSFSAEMAVAIEQTKNRGFLTVDLKSPELSVVRLRYAARTATIVGRTFEKEPTFVINRREQVRQLFPSAPDSEHLIWSSPKDLSAKVWLAVDPQYLRLRIDVLDDVHKQNFTGFNIWQGDSIQIGLAAPNQNGFWELGFALGKNGKVLSHCWTAPAGFAEKKAMADSRGSVVRDEQRGLTRYRIDLRRHAFGLTPNSGKEGVSFNLVINDCDEYKRENLMRLADGLGDIKAPRLWKVIGF